MERRLRRSVILKIVMHTLMFAAASVMVGCVIYTLWAVNEYGSPTNPEEKYVSSELFQREFDQHVGKLLDGVTTVDNTLKRRIGSQTYYSFYIVSEALAADMNELIKGAFSGSLVNFQYMVIDRWGVELASSDDWNEANLYTSGLGYYYVMDFYGVQAYDLSSYPSEAMNAVDQIDESSAEDWNGTVTDVVLDDNINSTMVSGQIQTYTNFDAQLINQRIYSGVYEPSFVGYIAAYVPALLEEGDVFYTNRIISDNSMADFKIPLILGIVSACIFLFCFIYTLLAAGWSRQSNTIRILWIDRIFTEIFLVLMVGAIVLIPYSLNDMMAGLVYTYVTDSFIYAIVRSCIVLLPVYIFGMIALYSFVRRGKAGTLIRHSVVYNMVNRMYTVIYKGFINNNLIRKYIAVIFGLGVLDLILIYVAIQLNTLPMWLITAVLFIYEFLYIGKKLLDIQDIAKGARQISGGNLNYKIDTAAMKGTFLEFAQNINNIGQGLNLAIDDSLKSERMKADLITNVSHDIKTPLTSIINYVDLLKRQKITAEPAAEYIRILDEKSQRLKVLTEDLVEASRASSGNIQLEKTMIDYVELVRQVAGTFNEKFEERKLEIILNAYQEPLLIFADGRRMHRVLENLFNNAYKYAMEGTRLYIDLYENDGKAYCVMKNISKAPLNISADELTQRFVRGDSSRTTEGSGLGLSIAQSLVELHGGMFDIYLDGDLFKVSVILDKYENEIEEQGQSLIGEE